MKLIVGLGNPGKEYENTRHNLGFIMLDNYVSTKSVETFKSKFNGLYTVLTVSGEKIYYLKPQSYMNLSGGVVKQFVDFFKIDVENILIICDDLDLNVGNIKLKSTGSSGGHNGLKDIESHLGTKDYKRLKIGIANHKLVNTKDYVLGKFSKEEQKIYKELGKIINDIIDDFLTMDFAKLMNKYNAKNR